MVCLHYPDVYHKNADVFVQNGCLPPEDRLVERHHFVRAAYDPCFLAFWNVREVQWPHMAADYMARRLVNAEQALRIPSCFFGVGKAMQTMGAIMPVIKEQIVEHSTFGQRAAVCVQMQRFVHPAAEFDDISAVIVGADFAVLDVAFHFLSSGLCANITQIIFNFLI